MTTTPDTAEIIRQLGEIKDQLDGEFSIKRDERSQVRSSLAHDAFEAASKLNPAVLKEIWDFHVSLGEHNLMAARGLQTQFGVNARDLLAATSLAELTKNLVQHVGMQRVNPDWMPYQYRK